MTLNSKLCIGLGLLFLSHAYVSILSSAAAINDFPADTLLKSTPPFTAALILRVAPVAIRYLSTLK